MALDGFLAGSSRGRRCVDDLAPGEMRLKPGHTYYITLRNPAGEPFSINWTWGVYGPGCFWRNHNCVEYWEADMNILEYAPTDAAPDAPGLKCISGEGFARIEYTAPKDVGVSKVQIRYRDGWLADGDAKLQDKFLAEVDVTPGQYGVIHDYDRPARMPSSVRCTSILPRSAWATSTVSRR